MNKTSRTDEPLKGTGYNQSPTELSNDLTTNEDFNGISNARELRGNQPPSIQDGGQSTGSIQDISQAPDPGIRLQTLGGGDDVGAAVGSSGTGELQTGKGVIDLRVIPQRSLSMSPDGGDGGNYGSQQGQRSLLRRILNMFITFGKFIGPGFMVAVAYSMPAHVDVVSFPGFR
jgi:metal iron transporter